MTGKRLSPIGPDYDAGEEITVSTTAVGPTAATVGDRRFAFFEVQDAAVRVRWDGTDPSATVGFELEPGDTLELDSSQQVSKVKFIRRDGVDATVMAHYGR